MSKHRRRRHERRRRHARPSRVIAGAGLSAGAVLGMAASSEAATFEVDRIDDPGVGGCTAAANDCSLRGAIASANAVSSDDGITFQSGLSGQITLTAGAITITDSAYIDGPGAGGLSVSGNNASRIFTIDPVTTGDFVGIFSLRLVGGSAVNGGAIYDADAELGVIDSVLSGNTATGKGGAIYEKGGYADGAYTSTAYSTISGNTAAKGGGIYALASAGYIIASTISGNNATTSTGGGIYAGLGAYAYDATIAGNGATAGGGIAGSAVNSSGLNNSIVADNTGGAFPDLSGSFDAAFSLIEAPGTATIIDSVPGSNIFGVDPQLGVLQNNGGSTATRRPAATSPVIDKGRSIGDTDQRGEPRPFDAPTIANSIAQLADAGDMGAVELQASEVPAATPTGPSIVQVPIPSKCGGRQADVGPNPGHSHGDARNNVIVGSPGPDVIRGRKGDDLICGLGGNDRLIGGTGKDRLIGGAGNDVLIGGQGEDQLKGGSGKDKLRQ